MRKNILTLLGVMMLIGIYVTPNLNAQVYSEFGQVEVLTNQTYVEIDGIQIAPNTFGLPPQFNDANRRDGYARIPIGFTYEFNGEAYDELFINVNGFVTFGSKDATGTLNLPPFLPPRNPNALFTEENSFPVNVIAPFWGDHIMRTVAESFQGFKQSFISYELDDQTDANGNEITDEDGNPFKVLTVQWKDLNINYLHNGQEIRSSVGNFQLKLYQSRDPFSNQGDIEFAYGQIGGNSSDQFNSIITRGASVGIKGEGSNIGQPADFLNGLINTAYFEERNQEYNGELSRTSTMLTDQWPPSSDNGRIDTRIRFNALGRFNVEEFWGDGDVDLSKAPGRLHSEFFNVQRRYVTLNDARVILKSVATGIPLDPVRRRAAYHGDVNHNGRYYINAQGDRINITTKSKNYIDDLPDDISSIRQILFEANEFDAALILQYLSARVPELPWLLDTIPYSGKRSADLLANSIELSNITNLYDNVYQAEVSLNGIENDGFGTKFEMNAEVLDLTVLPKNETITLVPAYSNSTAVLSGAGEFDANAPVAFVRFRTNENQVTLSNFRYNDNDLGNRTYSLAKSSTNEFGDMNISVSPNPFYNTTNFIVDVNFDATYKVEIYDMTGTLINTIHNGELAKGKFTFSWNGVDANNNPVNTGAYVIRLTNGSATVTEKVIYNR